MLFDEFDDEFEECDDGEAFDNTLVHFGEGFVDHLLAHRAKHWPALALVVTLAGQVIVGT